MAIKHILSEQIQLSDSLFDVLSRKCSSAQITQDYRKEELIGKQIIAAVNFPSKQIGKFMSEVLTLGIPDE